ncbi:hypothetical protein AMECASPLE_027320 [Ameca splendens]|uniref:Uncharacterized protein n=1 Tax=Ameca splendens TaxID=208324 RepID=A0ABV0ZQY8_9TELE
MSKIKKYVQKINCGKNKKQAQGSWQHIQKSPKGDVSGGKPKLGINAPHNGCPRRTKQQQSLQLECAFVKPGKLRDNLVLYGELLLEQKPFKLFSLSAFSFLTKCHLALESPFQQLLDSKTVFCSQVLFHLAQTQKKNVIY